MKKLLTVLLMICFTTFEFVSVKAQSDTEQTINGSVVDDSGEALIGATVVVAGTTKGATTDVEGKFSLKTTMGTTLNVSYIGYKQKDVKVISTTMKIVLAIDAEQLDEVVVTALGIKRDKKALGYAVSEVKGDAIANSGSSNVFSSLQGKGAGINIASPGSGVTGSTEIILRGNSSLTGSNGALIVVDGIPYSNSSNAGSDNKTYDFGSGIADLNPEDIESISVLKGANAAALYGSRALNGVVMINTKRGKSGKAKVSYSTELRFTELMYTPELQTEYGSGHGKNSKFGILPGAEAYNGQQTYQTDSYDEKAFGPKFEGQLVRNGWHRDNIILPYESQGNQIENFYRTAFTQIQNLSVSGGAEILNYNLSMRYEDIEDVQPSTNSSRYNIALRLDSKVNDYVGLDGKIAYTYAKTHNRPLLGSSSPYYGLMQMSNHIPFSVINPSRYPYSGKDYSNNYDQDGYRIGWNRGRYNPYWSLDENRTEDFSNRVVGFTKMNLSILKEELGYGSLTAFARVGWDHSSTDRKEIEAALPNTISGKIKGSATSTLEVNTDFYVTYQKQLSLLGITANVGGNRRYNEAKFQGYEASEFQNWEFESYNNSAQQKPMTPTKRKKALNSMYGSVQLALDDYLFVDITGRNDWSSTLPIKDPSFFYPSYNLGFVVTDAFKFLKNDVLSYAKLRASYAEVGNDLGVYQIATYYDYSTDASGRTNARVSNTVGNENIEPELNKSLEFGGDLRLLENRLRFDFTWYKSATENQIVSNYEQAISTGYTSLLYNVGEISNKGIEFSISGTPIKTEDLRWDLTFNYATNETVLEEYSNEGESFYKVQGLNDGNEVRAYPGQKFGDIYGYPILKDKNGTVVVNSEGFPIIDNRGDKVKLGNVQPDYTMSIQSSLKYKNFTFSFLIDGSFGGDVFSYTARNLNRNGFTKTSLEGREGWQRALEQDTELRGKSKVGSNIGGYGKWVGNSVFAEEALNENGKMVAVFDQNGDVKTRGKNEGANAKYLNPYEYWSDGVRNGKMNNTTNGEKSGTPEEYLEDATYIKLRELTVSYQLPKEWLKPVGIQSLSVGATGRNLLYLNDVSEFFDPDSYRNGTGIHTLGVDRSGPLPSLRSYSFNVRLQF
jgi:TonB-linked SusC/RagA family outer membrane protein